MPLGPLTDQGEGEGAADDDNDVVVGGASAPGPAPAADPPTPEQPIVPPQTPITEFKPHPIPYNRKFSVVYKIFIYFSYIFRVLYGLRTFEK